MPKRSSDHVVQSKKTPLEADENLFYFDKNHQDSKQDQDSSDSEESEYSGLESEPETSEDDDNEQDSGEEKETDDESSNDSEGEEEKEDEDTEKDNTEQNNNQGEKSPKKSIETFDEDNTSDEEDARNTIGNIPVEWYNDYPHLGYDLDGKRILKPATADELDQFLSKMDDPNYWRTVRDKATMKEIVLSNEELDIIDRLQNSQFPSGGYDPYEVWCGTI